MKSRAKERTYLFYLILTIGACLSFVFTNVSYDAEYQLAMAYRMIKGDEMIIQMWEPHQTSAFLCVIFMKIYMFVTGTTTGIVLYMQVVGLLIRGGIAYWMFRTIKEWAGEKPAILAGWFYLIISPKELLVPEFGNMQLWFATIMYLLLLQYMKKKKVICLIGSAISLCLSVFSYPSMVICYIAVLVILWHYSDSFKKDILIFTTVCVLIGGSFVLYLFINVGLETILACLESALAVEPTHTVGMGDKIWAHILNVAKIFSMLAGVGIIGFVAENIRCLIKSKKSGNRERISGNGWLTISWFVLMFFFLINILSVENRGGYAFPFVVVLGLGFWKRDLLSAEEKCIYYSAVWVSVFSLLATLILSDNAFLQAITYMLIWICASIVPIYRWYQQLAEKETVKRAFVCGMHVWMLLIIFRCVYIHIPIYGRGQIHSILDEVAMIRSGPAMGIITDEEGAARQRDSMAEWSSFVQPGDTIWILGEPVDTLGYLYEDVEVGAPTVMSTPTYNEELEYYWELNPQKYPDVVILSSSYGELAWELKKNEWLMNWLETEYCADAVTDGKYWRYYERRR